MSGPHAHSHGLDEVRHERPLCWALALTGGFLVAEVVGAFLTDSLALLSDAAHMVTDVAALALALAAIRIGRRPPDDRRTYGYRRLEVIAAGVNALILLAVAIYILVEAIERLRRPTAVQTTGMLVIGALGLIVNLIALRLLAAGSASNLNVRGAYLEVWSDALGSIGVVAAALVIAWTGWLIVDPIVALAIGAWVVPRTWMLLREAGNVLLEGVPTGVDIDAIRKALRELPGVTDIHDLHVWSVSSGRHLLTAHLVIDATQSESEVLPRAGALLATQFALPHATLQIERSQCAPTRRCDAGESPAAGHNDHDHEHD